MSTFSTPTRNLYLSSYKPATSLYQSSILSTSTRVITSSPTLRTSVKLEESLREIKQRYEAEARLVQDHYESHYNDHLNVVKHIEELELLLEEERSKNFELETKYNRAMTDLDRERKLREEAEHEALALKEQLRKVEALLSESQVEITRLDQQNVLLNNENVALRKEIERLTEVYNAKLREMEDQFTIQKRQLTGEIDRLKAQLEQLRLGYESRIQSLERESSLKFSQFEERLREKDLIIAGLEAEIKKRVDALAQLKIQYEEELRRQIALVREEERVKTETIVKNFEAQLRQLQEEKDTLYRRNQELTRELALKEKQYQELKAKYESEIARYKIEISDLRSQIAALTSENDKLRNEVSNKDAIIKRLEGEIANLQREIQRLKDAHAQEISRLINEHNLERRKWEEVDRQNQARIQELEKYLRTLEAENHQLKLDIEKLKEMISGNIQKTIFQTFQDYEVKTSHHQVKSIF